jgi:FkbM family methyltransferase
VVNGIGIDNLLWEHEHWIESVIAALLPKVQGAFLDVGVNIGQTLLKVKRHDRARQYYGFEPNPLCVFYVEALIDANGWDAHVIPVGLGDKPSVAKLLMRDAFDREASIVEKFRPGYYSAFRHVPIVVGDDLVRQLMIPAISIIKIDVEGGELEVLQGFRNTVDSHRPFILCEVLPVYDESTEQGKYRRARVDAILDILKVSEYSIFSISKKGDLLRLETIKTHSNLADHDYLFAPNEGLQLVLEAERTVNER